MHVSIAESGQTEREAVAIGTEAAALTQAAAVASVESAVVSCEEKSLLSCGVVLLSLEGRQSWLVHGFDLRSKVESQCQSARLMRMLGY